MEKKTCLPLLVSVTDRSDDGGEAKYTLGSAAARVRVRVGMWGLWSTKRHWGRFSPSTSVSPANHSTNFSIITITRGWHNRPISGRSTEWT
jgi:hypothetical protein